MPRMGTSWKYAGKLDWRYGETQGYRQSVSAVPIVSGDCGTFTKLPSGEWHIECGGEACTIPDMRGARCLAAMLRRPGHGLCAGSLRSLPDAPTETFHERRARLLQETMAACSERVVKILQLERSLTRAPISLLERAKRKSEESIQTIKKLLNVWTKARFPSGFNEPSSEAVYAHYRYINKIGVLNDDPRIPLCSFVNPLAIRPPSLRTRRGCCRGWIAERVLRDTPPDLRRY